ncbi:MAG: efflux RND transporter periplasmic adaptor subunit [Candidatus Rokubacteria bacterium]|nr:efflux RND transporter periplasmic adaptor subunit [Candidatus Rokubacteria bacterium]
MRRRVVALLMASAAVALAACSRTEQPDDPARTKLPAARVQVEVAGLRVVPATVEAIGTVRSREQSLLSARIVAAVRAVHARDGDRVRVGQLLVELDDRDVRAQRQRAEAALREARSALDEAERAIQAAARAVESADAQLELTRVTEARYKALVARELIAPQDYDEVAARWRAAVAEAARVREVQASLVARRQQTVARIAQAEADLDGATVALGYARITAPTDAIVVARTVEVGNLAAPGTPLLTVEEERYRLEAAVQESDVARLRAGQPATVAVDALGRTLAGAIVEIVPAADPSSRTFVVKVTLPGAPGLRSGQYGRARFTVGEERRLTVPRAAVAERGQLEVVFIVDAGGVARLRLVKTGRIHDDRVEALAGLGEGERLVVGGDRVEDGQRVVVER